MRSPTFLKVLGLVIFLGITTGGVANAQASVSDAKLQAFITAALAVSKVIEEWTPRIESAESQEAAEGLIAQANTELVAAIEATGGITLQEYKEIFDAARKDPTLSARIEEMFQRR